MKNYQVNTDNSKEEIIDSEEVLIDNIKTNLQKKKIKKN